MPVDLEEESDVFTRSTYVSTFGLIFMLLVLIRHNDSSIHNEMKKVRPQ